MEGELNELCERLDATKLEQKSVKVDTKQLVGVISKGANCMFSGLLIMRPIRPPCGKYGGWLNYKVP